MKGGSSRHFTFVIKRFCSERSDLPGMLNIIAGALYRNFKMSLSSAMSAFYQEMRMNACLVDFSITLPTMITYDHNQDPAVLSKVIKINYNEKKNSKEKTMSELVFPIFRTLKPSFFEGFNENTDSRYNM